MKNQYVFDDEQTAIDAEKYISKIAGFPWVGNNAKTGKPEPNKQKTLRWAEVRQRATDGKYYFERLSESDIESTDVSKVDKFNADYPHTVEELQSNWAVV